LRERLASQAWFGLKESLTDSGFVRDPAKILWPVSFLAENTRTYIYIRTHINHVFFYSLKLEFQFGYDVYLKNLCSYL